MKRWWVYPGFLLLALAGFLVYQWNVTHFHLGYWLQLHTGTINESGPYYGFFSGFGSDLGEYVIIVAVFTGIYHAVKKGNCHKQGCWRIGLLPVGNPPYRVCKKHHLEATGTTVTMEHLKRHHSLAHRKRLIDAGCDPDA